jgi:hypothetical protein
VRDFGRLEIFDLAHSTYRRRIYYRINDRYDNLPVLRRVLPLQTAPFAWTERRATQFRFSSSVRLNRGKDSRLYSTLLYSTLLYSTLLYSTLLYSTLRLRAPLPLTDQRLELIIPNNSTQPQPSTGEDGSERYYDAPINAKAQHRGTSESNTLRKNSRNSAQLPDFLTHVSHLSTSVPRA